MSREDIPAFLRRMCEHGPDRKWWFRTAFASGIRVMLWVLATNLFHS